MSEMKKFVLLCSVVFLAGCATTLESKFAQTFENKDHHRFNLSKTENTGVLMLHCVPPSQQLFISRYMVKIDENAPLNVFKYSDSEITLDEGKHVLEFYAIPDAMQCLYKEQFGKSYLYEVEIIKDKMVGLEYTGPYSAFSKGKIKELGTFDKAK